MQINWGVNLSPDLILYKVINRLWCDNLTDTVFYINKTNLYEITIIYPFDCSAFFYLL